MFACSVPYSVTDTQLVSVETGDTYDLRVLEPIEGTDRVLVVTDGDYIARYEGAYADAVEQGSGVALVAVGYQGFRTGLRGGLDDETMERRARDFTTEEVEGMPGTGQAAAFQEFLAVELLGELDSMGLPVEDPSVFGFSAFGWAALTARVTHDADWAQVCAGSPSLLLDGDPVWSESDLPATAEGATLGTVGSAETVDAAELQELVDAWRDAGLAIEHEVFDGTDHADAMEPAMASCLALL